MFLKWRRNSSWKGRKQEPSGRSPAGSDCPDRKAGVHLQSLGLHLVSSKHGFLIKVHWKSSEEDEEMLDSEFGIKMWWKRFITWQPPTRQSYDGRPQPFGTNDKSSCWYLGCCGFLLDLAEQLQQQLFGASILPTVSCVKVDDRSLKVRHHFVECPQLDQEQEVQVLQTPCALPFGLPCVKTASELLEVWTPNWTSPPLWGSKRPDIQVLFR